MVELSEWLVDVTRPDSLQALVETGLVVSVVGLSLVMVGLVLRRRGLDRRDETP